MKWTHTKEGDKEVVLLMDDQHGEVGFIREQIRSVNPKQWVWEVEFSAGDLDLYWNDIFTGTISGAKKKLLEMSQFYLEGKITEFSKLRDRLNKEQKVIAND